MYISSGLFPGTPSRFIPLLPAPGFPGDTKSGKNKLEGKVSFPKYLFLISGQITEYPGRVRNHILPQGNPQKCEQLKWALHMQLKHSERLMFTSPQLIICGYVTA